MQSEPTPLAHLLIVDDEQLHLHALRDTLAAHGYQVTPCASGAQALEAIEHAAFDLLLTDLHMPGMDGIELLRQAQVRDPSIICIIMTGQGTIATAVQAMQSGALDYILKPFRLNVALPVIARALQVRQLRMRNALLEAQVRKQMDALALANAELEAFSHSVSHDLRAPLQVVEGFSAVLAARHAGQLDDKGMHYLNRIRAGIAQMNDLIEGLLRLSRVGREPLQRRAVDVGLMVESVLQGLRDEGVLADDRVHVTLLDAVQADPLLLRQLYVNLLSNACKFTSKCELPRIDVGCMATFGECVYFVRDNGAGFDMQYAQKLFTPFQRLHRTAEFPGLGVGLSIVQRIVQRHGGRIWAEAAQDNGACFYFTVPA